MFPNKYPPKRHALLSTCTSNESHTDYLPFYKNVFLQRWEGSVVLIVFMVIGSITDLCRLHFISLYLPETAMFDVRLC